MIFSLKTIVFCLFFPLQLVASDFFCTPHTVGIDHRLHPSHWEENGILVPEEWKIYRDSFIESNTPLTILPYCLVLEFTTEENCIQCNKILEETYPDENQTYYNARNFVPEPFKTLYDTIGRLNASPFDLFPPIFLHAHPLQQPPPIPMNDMSKKEDIHCPFKGCNYSCKKTHSLINHWTENHTGRDFEKDIMWYISPFDGQRFKRLDNLKKNLRFYYNKWLETQTRESLVLGGV